MNNNLKIFLTILAFGTTIALLVFFYWRNALTTEEVITSPETHLPITSRCSDPNLSVPEIELPENVHTDIFVPRYEHCCVARTEQRVLVSSTTWGDEGETGIDLFDLKGKQLAHYDTGSPLFPNDQEVEYEIESCQYVHPDYFFEYVESPETERFLREHGYYYE